MEHSVSSMGFSPVVANGELAIQWTTDVQCFRHIPDRFYNGLTTQLGLIWIDLKLDFVMHMGNLPCLDQIAAGNSVRNALIGSEFGGCRDQ